MMTSLLLLSTLAACETTADGFCRQNPCKVQRTAAGDAFCTGRVVMRPLTKDQRVVFLGVFVAFNDEFKIEFPRGARLRGDVSYGNEAVFQVEKRDNSTLIVRTIPPRETVTLDQVLGQRTTLNVELEGGWRLAIDLQVARPSASVRYLIFEGEDVEDFAKERDVIYEQCKAEMREALVDTVAVQARERMSLGVLQKAVCNDDPEIEMVDGLWVRQERICQVGRDIYVIFRIRNRARGDQFRVGAVEVVADGSPVVGELAFASADGFTPVGIEEVALAYAEEILGVVSFQAEQASPELTLRVQEASGKQRVVEVEDVSF